MVLVNPEQLDFGIFHEPQYGFMDTVHRTWDGKDAY